MSLINLHQIILLQFVLLAVVLVCEAIPPPETKACCRSHGVDEFCVRILCDVHKPPNVDEIYHEVTRCGHHLPAISGCLADGRNHTSCCRKDTKKPQLTTTCFDFCDASAKPFSNKPWWHHLDYALCLGINRETIYRCFRKGYKTNPSPPQHLTLRYTKRKTKHDWKSSYFRWESPHVHPSFVDKYIVFYGRMGDKNNVARTVIPAARMPALSIGGLQPDTKYYLYVVASNAKGTQQSLPSNKLNFTTKGVRPTIMRYEGQVQAIPGSTQTYYIVCLINVTGVEHKGLQVQWQKRVGNETYKVGIYESLHHRIANPLRYTSVFYKSSNSFKQPRSYVAALAIRNVTQADYGVFRCVAWNAFGNASALVRLRKRTLMVHPSSPPNPTACCERIGVQQQCLPTCTQRAGDRNINQSRFCALHFPKSLACSVHGLEQGACCLKRRVPQHCLPLCDMNERLSDGATLSSCHLYTSDIFHCRLEAMALLPSRPTSLAVSNPTASSIDVRCVGSERAELYHYFYRSVSNSKEKWQRYNGSLGADAQTRLVGLQPNLTYEVVVVATNRYGYSEASETKRVTTVVTQSPTLNVANFCANLSNGFVNSEIDYQNAQLKIQALHRITIEEGGICKEINPTTASGRFNVQIRLTAEEKSTLVTTIQTGEITIEDLQYTVHYTANHCSASIHDKGAFGFMEVITSDGHFYNAINSWLFIDSSRKTILAALENYVCDIRSGKVVESIIDRLRFGEKISFCWVGAHLVPCTKLLPVTSLPHMQLLRNP